MKQTDAVNHFMILVLISRSWERVLVYILAFLFVYAALSLPIYQFISDSQITLGFGLLLLTALFGMRYVIGVIPVKRWFF